MYHEKKTNGLRYMFTQVSNYVGSFFPGKRAERTSLDELNVNVPNAEVRITIETTAVVNSNHTELDESFLMIERDPNTESTADTLNIASLSDNAPAESSINNQNSSPPSRVLSPISAELERDWYDVAAEYINNKNEKDDKDEPAHSPRVKKGFKLHHTLKASGAEEQKSINTVDYKIIDGYGKLTEQDKTKPLANRPSSHYVVTFLDSKHTDKASHKMGIATYLTLHPDNKSVITVEDLVNYYKEIDPSKWKMAVLEAANSAFYCYLVPDVVSPSYAIYNESGEYVAVVSEAVENYLSFKNKKLTLEDLDDPIKVKKLAEMLVSSYLFMEDDLHRGNIGLNGRIDFDMSFWPAIMKHIKGARWTGDVSVDKFKITADDIRNFPILGDNQCHFWPTKNSVVDAAADYIGMSANGFKADENVVFCALKDNPTFIYHKFKCMLKFLVSMSDNVCRGLASRHIPSDMTINVYDDESASYKEVNAIELYIKVIKDRKEQLLDVLHSMPEFKSFIEKDGLRAMEEINAELKVVDEKTNQLCTIVGPNSSCTLTDFDKVNEEYNYIREFTVNGAKAKIANVLVQSRSGGVPDIKKSDMSEKSELPKEEKQSNAILYVSVVEASFYHNKKTASSEEPSCVAAENNFQPIDVKGKQEAPASLTQ